MFLTEYARIPNPSEVSITALDIRNNEVPVDLFPYSKSPFVSLALS